MNKILSVVPLAAALLLAAPLSHATLLHFSANLDGPGEFPANASPASGFAMVDLDTSAHTMHVNITFSGLLGTSTASHIHCCVAPDAAVPTAGVATTTPTFTGFPLGVTSGTYDHLFDLTLASSFNPSFITAHGGTEAGAEAFLTAGMIAGESYVNIHTTQFAGGEIRGFLQAVPAQVPEPGTISLLGFGLLACAAMLRHRPILW